MKNSNNNSSFFLKFWQARKLNEKEKVATTSGDARPVSLVQKLDRWVQLPLKESVEPPFKAERGRHRWRRKGSVGRGRAMLYTPTELGTPAVT